MKWNNRRGKGPGMPRKDTQNSLSRTTSRHESLYSNRVGFIKRAQRSVGLGNKHVSISQSELQRFSSHQAAGAGATLARHPSRPQA